MSSNNQDDNIKKAQKGGSKESDQCPPDDKRGYRYPWGGGFDYPFGGDSTACNIANLAMNIQNTMSTDIIQTNTSTQNNSFVVKADCDTQCGTFSYHDNKNVQVNQANMNNTQRAYSTNSAQQQMLFQMVQQASAVTKGLALLPQDSQATNMINGYMRMSNNMTTNISQTCATSQSNTVEFDVDNHSDVDIYNNVYLQAGQTTVDCNQAAIARNTSMQSVTVQIAQIASALSQGLSEWFLIIIVIAIVSIPIVFEGGVVYVGGQNTSSFAIMLGAGFLVISVLVFLMMYLFWTNTAYITYGMSPTIPESECKNNYQLHQDKTSYDSYAKAQKQCKKMHKHNNECTAFDWEYSGDANKGYATFYKGGPTNPLDECGDITGLGDKDKTSEVVTIRPTAFLNMLNLKPGAAPSADTVADVVLNSQSGELWVKMPPGYDSCNVPGPDDQMWASTNWKFQQPSSLEAGNANDVWHRIDPDGKCGTTCGSGCPFIPALTQPKSSMVYFYIDPSQTIDLNLDPDNPTSRWNYGANRYETWLTGEVTMLSGYQWDFASPVGNAMIKVHEGDYFLLPFPYGPTDTQDPTTWPDGKDGTALVFQSYAFGGQYYLYRAVKYNDQWLPYKGYVPNQDIVNPAPPAPVNVITGYGIFPIVSGYFSTTFAISYRLEGFFWAMIATGAVGLLLVFVGIYMSSHNNESFSAWGLPEQTSAVQQTTPVHQTTPVQSRSQSKSQVNHWTSSW